MKKTRMFKKMRFGKKGSAEWISWVLIIAFTAVLAAFMFGWTKSFTDKQTGKMKEVYDSLDCNYVQLSIDSICQNTQTLNMNITNRKNIDIDKLIFRIYDIYGNPEGKEVDLFIRHGKSNSEYIEVIKQGVASVVEVVPVFIKNDKKVICDQRKVTLNNIEFC
jgi:hypothetical protein